MSAHTDLDRLAAARPAWLDHTELVIDSHVEELMLRQVLASSRRARTRGAGPRPAARWARLPRSRRLTVTAVAGVAAVTAAASVTAGLGGFGHTSGAHAVTAGRGQVITVSDIARRTVAAATAATESGIVGSRTQYAPGTAGSAAVINDWSYGMEVRATWYNAHGARTEDDSAVVTDGSRDRRFVDYETRTWQQDSFPAAQYHEFPGAISSEVDELLGLPAGTQPGSSPSASNGAGGRITRVQADGRALYQVTIRYRAGALENDPWPLPMFTNLEALPNSTVAGVAVETVWIDATTFLPVQVRMTTPGGRFMVSESLTWLTPSRANLGVFSPAPIPAGFHYTQEAAH